jgi:uncharacterized membrane protein YidH (DUF202 family)
MREALPTDYLANERTFLAWIRTAVTIMAFGFVVARFGLLLRELAGGPGEGGEVAWGACRLVCLEAREQAPQVAREGRR